MNLYSVFKPLVFDWLNVISKGTNKEVVEQLLTPKGISHTFGLPISLSTRFFNKWNNK